MAYELGYGTDTMLHRTYFLLHMKWHVYFTDGLLQARQEFQVSSDELTVNKLIDTVVQSKTTGTEKPGTASDNCYTSNLLVLLTGVFLWARFWTDSVVFVKQFGDVSTVLQRNRSRWSGQKLKDWLKKCMDYVVPMGYDVYLLFARNAQKRSTERQMQHKY